MNDPTEFKAYEIKEEGLTYRQIAGRLKTGAFVRRKSWWDTQYLVEYEYKAVSTSFKRSTRILCEVYGNPKEWWPTDDDIFAQDWQEIVPSDDKKYDPNIESLTWYDKHLAKLKSQMRKKDENIQR